MIARCARCQQTFSTDRFGVQTCPHCGGQVMLAEPGAPGAGAPPPSQPPAGGSQPPAGGPPPAAGGPPPVAGAPPGWGGPPPGWGPPPGAAPPGPPPGEESAPFARRKQLGFFASYFRTWKLASLEPGAFFRSVRVGESGSAVLFAVISLTVSQWFQTLYGWLVDTSMRGFMQEIMRRMPQQQAEIDPRIMELISGTHPGVVAARIIGAPLYALVTLFLTAGVIHLFLLLFKAAPRRFETTLTVVGYASGVQLLAAAPVPGLAPLAATVWFLVATIVGLGAAQRCGNGKAAAATLLPGGLFCLCCCGGVGALMAIAASAAKHGG
ncbi:MAG TPA: YIP1 family protein [Anaeromyxobacteraceae bacterium]|nr:YIP1 family protein [Anaeromyxobacteraceae bacterium]